MTDFLNAHPDPFFDLSITLSIYGNWDQVTQRVFSLRNLAGQTEEAHIAHARQIMDDVAEELHYITNLGIDKGVIRIGKKRVEETLYPELRPHEDVRYFLYGVNVAFFPVFRHAWVNEKRKRIIIHADQLDEGWERRIVERRKQVSFRLPVHATQKQEKLFFCYQHIKKQGRRVVGWFPSYNKDDELFVRFIARFDEDGNLCFGRDRYWGKHISYFTGSFWKLPEIGGKKAPRKSQIASQPVDNTDYVYLIRMGRTKMYKIGKTNDPQGRVANLQTASPYKLKLLHTFKADNASAAEEALHAKFYAVRQEGEWFKLSDEEREKLTAVTEYRDRCFFVNGEGLTVEELFVGK
ncbi:MAG: GIY-YIG nuclease family protein [Chloroflexota bacterium]